MQSLGQELSAQGQSALLQTCLSIISQSPSRFAKQTHVSSPINYYSSLSVSVCVSDAYNYSVRFRVRCNNIFLWRNYHVGAVSKLASFAQLTSFGFTFLVPNVFAELINILF